MTPIKRRKRQKYDKRIFAVLHGYTVLIGVIVTLVLKRQLLHNCLLFYYHCCFKSLWNLI